MESEPTPANGTSFSTKEMLVRLDGKLDVVLNKQNHYDVELALLKARVEEHERNNKEALSHMRVTVEERTEDSSKWRDEVRDRIDAIDEAAEDVRAKQKATAYIVGAIVTLSTVITPIVLSIISN